MILQNSVGIYTDSDTCLFHFNQINFQKQHTVYNSDITNFLLDNHDRRFALFHVPFYRDTSWLDRLDQVYSKSDYIFIFCSELHSHTVSQLKLLDKDKIVLLVCGFIDFDFKNAKIYNYMDWFITTTDFYKEVQPDLLKTKLRYSVTKTKYFDILLGCIRSHRDYVFNYIHQYNLNDKVIMTYFRYWNVDLRKTEHIFESEGLEFLPESAYTHTVHHVLYYGRKTNLSQIVPFTIYNDSYYSLVAETNAVNEFNFYTEKIVKPILAKRLFVAIAGKHYLYNLRKLGFKTFDGVIDESYDNEDDDNTRWLLAMDQVRSLISQNPEEIDFKIKDVVEHNQRLMLETNWYGSVVSIISNLMYR
jgi:hypothetical protein